MFGVMGMHEQTTLRAISGNNPYDKNSPKYRLWEALKGYELQAAALKAEHERATKALEEAVLSAAAYRTALMKLDA